ncbi:MAG TPA: hypothetical protein VGF87_02665 [Acidimicrobiales bacterium]
MRRSLLLALSIVAAVSLPVLSGGTSGASAPSPNPAWVRDTVQQLNIFLPDGDSDYWINGWGADNGARTVISGQAPHARYWSFTAYPFGSNGTDTHLHDTQIAQSDGRYRVTLTSSCAHVAGTCLDTSTTGTSGLLVLRLYVPVDYSGAGTGEVPLPTLTYENAKGSPLSLSAAAGTTKDTSAIQFLNGLHGQLPAALTKPYPAQGPVPTPVVSPVPIARPTGPMGVYANPDNLYDHIALSTSRGDLVLTAKPPTYQDDVAHPANSLSHPAGSSTQVRYWSICVTDTGRATGACLRDDQVHLGKNGQFVIIVSPTCPVAGFANCLVSGPAQIQTAIAYRNLLPSASFKSQAFRGPYALRGAYVARPPTEAG